VAKFASGNTITSYILNISNYGSQNPRVSLVITSKDKNYRAEIFDFDPGMSIQINPEQKEELENEIKHLKSLSDRLAVITHHYQQNNP